MNAAWVDRLMAIKSVQHDPKNALGTACYEGQKRVVVYL